MVYPILISTMYLHFSIFFLVFMMVGLVGEAVVIAQDFRPLIPPLFLSPDNTTRILNRRQHRWAEFLQSFNFKVVYRAGRLNEKADALSSRRDYRPKGGSNSDPYTFFCPHQYVG